ncbi:MAG: hypothetical protein LQ338_004058 [Usnochroma carphineum]|nr:MAG: hypothetical protein LQ338_004058 [Usnochroma carphineum]
MRGLCGSFVSILYLLSAASAAPAKIGEKSFKIHRRAIGSPKARNGVAELSKAYRKYGWKVPEGLSNKVQIPQNISTKHAGGEGTVKTTPEEGDVSFLSPVTVGGQTLMMDFDTGSSDLWVFNSHLQPQVTQGHSVYDPSKSSSFKPMEGASWKIHYGDSSAAEGIVGTDTVNIGGAEVQGQAVELATQVTDSFTDDVSSDGLLGLGFGSINTVRPQKQKTFFENVLPSLDKPVFTANLKHHTVGSYEFGRIDATQFKGPLAYAKVDPSQGFWQIDSQSFSVGDNGTKQTNPNAGPAIIDSGTSLILADDAVVRSYWRQVQGAQIATDSGTVTFPCNAQLPDFHVALGPSYMATVPGELMNFSRLGANKCMGGMQSNQGQGLQVYGDVLFKAQFVAFDGGNMAVGFAPHA